MRAMDRLPTEFHKVFAMLARAFAPHGATEESMVEGVLTELAARVPASRPPVQRDYFEAWVNHYKTSLPPLSAIFAGLELPFGFYEVVDFLAASCSDVGEGFHKIAGYFALVRPEVQIVVHEDEHYPRVCFFDQRRPNDWFFDEWTVAVCLGRFRQQLHVPFYAAECRLRRPRPDAAIVQRAQEALGAELRFGESEASLSFSRDVWELKLPGRNTRLKEMLERNAAELIAEASGVGAASRQVRALLSSELRGGDPSIENVAKRLALTPRTLQRRLRDEDASFQGLLDEVRAQLAKRYLDDERLGVTDVAFLLGYADASAFARAFRRWYGKAPAEARRREPVASPRS